MKPMKLFVVLAILLLMGISGCVSNNPPPTPSTSTGTVSGRIISNDVSLSPVYNASVLVNGQPAVIYGSTYLALNVSTGTATVEVHNGVQTKTETVTVQSGIVNSADVIFSTENTETSPTAGLTADHLLFTWENGLSLELLLSGNQILGIGDVQLNGVHLRNPTSSGTLTVQQLQNGRFVSVTVTSCQYLSYETKGNIAIVHSSLATSVGTLDVDWIFSPWDMTVDNIQYEGIGYRFTVTSPATIAKIGFNCSWELAETINGKTLLIRREMTAWEQSCTQATTISLRAPTYLGMTQPPDYQYDDSGALATYIWPPADDDNTLQKTGGSDQLWFSDTFSLGETKQADTPFRVILYTNQGSIDDYTDLFDHITGDYQKFYGLHNADIVPTAITRNYLNAGPGLEPPYRSVADTQLPEFASHYFKHVDVLSIWVSNGRIGSPYNGNRLATQSIDVYPADTNDVHYFANKTHSLGMELSIWLSICYSQKSPTLPVNTWRVTNADGTYNTGPVKDIYVLSYRSGYLAYAIQQLKEIQTNYGFNGIWHDSFTQGFDIDYGQTTIKSSLDPLMQYVAATQRMGYGPYLEALSPFGVTGIGSVFVTPKGQGTSSQGTRDINTAYAGREYLAYKTAFTLWETSDFNPIQIDYYKFLANKACPMINYAYLSDTEKTDVAQANKDYNTVSTYMDHRHILPHDDGILWNDSTTNTQVLFSYTTSSYTVNTGRTQVLDVTNNTPVTLINGAFATQTKHTYLIQ